MRASTWPAVTWSPGFTSTSVTTALALKPSPRVPTGCTVPAADEVSTTAPRWTRAVLGAAAGGAWLA
jgi:hypothetical protein